MKWEGLPSWVREEPPPVPLQGFYMNAFWELSTERQIGMAMGPIPHSKILEYGERRGLGRVMMRLFVHVIRGLDRAYTEWSTEQHNKLSK